MDDRERRQVRMEFEVDDVVLVDVPEWWSRLTASVVGRWRRELTAVIVAIALGFAAGVAVGTSLG